MKKFKRIQSDRPARHRNRKDPVEVRYDRQQKQITQKTAEIAKGLGMNRPSTGCKTKFSPARQRAPALQWLIIKSMRRKA
jgi:hypothetical protein